MADSSLSALTAATSAGLTDLFYVVQGGTPKKITPAEIAALLRESAGLPLVKSLAADGTGNTSVTPAKQTGLDLALGIGLYQFTYKLRYQTAALTTGIRFDVNHSGTVTAFLWNQYWVDVSAAAATAAPDQDQITATSGGVLGAFASRAKGTAGRGTTVSVDTANADMLMIIEGMAVVTVAGNLELYMGTEIAASQAILKAGSSLVAIKVG